MELFPVLYLYWLKVHSIGNSFPLICIGIDIPFISIGIPLIDIGIGIPLTSICIQLHPGISIDISIWVSVEHY